MSMDRQDRIFVDKQDRITVFENNLVTLTLADGRVFEKLEPRRLFPVNDGDRYIILLNEEGKEVAIIRNRTDLDKSSAQVIRDSLNAYYLVPYITEILSITLKSGTLTWKVKTDRGYKQFDVRNRNQDIKVFRDGTVRVRDADDNRYVIEDYHKLDAHSRRQLASDL